MSERQSVQPTVHDEERAAIREALNTQDNRITVEPIFAVQQRVREPTNEDNAVGWEWRNRGGDWEKADDDKAAILDAQAEEGSETGGWVRVFYRDRWEFVTACFTQRGCEAYIAINGHNLRDPRIYVYSGFRNAEWQTIRAYLRAPSGAGWRPDARYVEVLADRAHTLAMGVLQSDAGPRFRGEIQDIIDMVDAFGRPLPAAPSGAMNRGSET